MIFLPSSQFSFKNDKGSNVLFPAPGGALTMSVLASVKWEITCVMISCTGKLV
jgi:hypothetical protein